MKAPTLQAETIAHLGDLPITNTLLATWVAMAILILLALALRFRLAEVPRGLQNAAEWVIEGMLRLVREVLGERRLAERAFPLLATLFLFILTANWIGLIPGFGPFGLWEFHEGKAVLVPLLRPANTDLNSTLAWAIISVALTQAFGIAAAGLVGYGRRFLNFKNPLTFFVGILEALSEAVKVISFSFRLFGNMFAGKVLLVIIGTLLPFLAPLPFYLLELFVGAIQALVFAMLTLVFMKVAVEVASH